MNRLHFLLTLNEDLYVSVFVCLYYPDNLSITLKACSISKPWGYLSSAVWSIGKVAEEPTTYTS